MTTPYDFRHPSRAKHADSPDPTVVIIAHHDHDHSPSHGSNRSVPVSSRSFHAESETKHSPPDGVQTSTSESGDDCIDRRHSYDAEQDGRTVSSKKTPRPPVSIILTRALTADERKLKLDIEPESLTLSHTLNSDSSTRNLHHPTLALDTVWVTRPSKVTTPLPPSPSSHSFCYPLTTLLRDVFGVKESDSFLLCLWRLRTLWAFLLIMALFVVAMALLLFTAEHPEPGRCPVGCVRQDCRVTPDQPILPCFCNDDTTCADLDTSNAMTSSPKGIAAIWLFGVAGSLCVIWGVLRIFSSCQSRPR